MEINAINIANEALKEKLKKRSDQLKENEAEVNKHADEIRKATKLITPKSTKALWKAYNDKPNDKLKAMVEAFVGILLNRSNVTYEEVKVSKHSIHPSITPHLKLIFIFTL